MIMDEIDDEYKIPPLIDPETQWGYHRFEAEHLFTLLDLFNVEYPGTLIHNIVDKIL